MKRSTITFLAIIILSFLIPTGIIVTLINPNQNRTVFVGMDIGYGD